MSDADVRRLVYVANARLPTEKAHGYQICKMCEAFSEAGVDVTLLHASRRQPTALLRSQSIFDYYGIRPSFQVRTAGNWDVVLVEPFVRGRTFVVVFLAHAILWGLYASRLAERERADVYYTRDAAVAYWLTRLGLPIVYEAHVVPGRMERWLVRRVARSGALRLVVALNSFIKGEFRAIGVPSAKLTLSPNGVDPTLFENLPSREECRRRLSLPCDQSIVGYIGRFRTMEMEKGIPELVQAMALKQMLDSPGTICVCIGGPMDAVPGYTDLARRLGLPLHRLRFMDRVSNTEVPYWIRAFDVAVAPFPDTRYYAYSMTPLKVFEYMAAGVPLVASDLPSIREVLSHGENAWLVEPGSPAALAHGIRMILDDRGLADRLATRARQDVRRFTWAERSRRILDVLRDQRDLDGS